MIITILAAIGVFVLLIFVHELGHFITAKACRVRVEEFGIGFPPRLFGIRRGETLYSVNALPLGGFTKMAGEEDPKVPRSLASKGTGTRILVLSAGSMMNALLPLLLFSVAFMIPHNMVMGEVIIEEVAPSSPAARAGIEAGDVILTINGKPVNNSGDLHRYLQLNLGKETAIAVKHSNSTTEEVQVIPRWRPPEGQGATGILVNMLQPAVVRQSYPFWKAIPMGAVEYKETYVLFKNGIVSMLIGAIPARVTGPVGIVQITGEVAKAGLTPLLQFAAFLSINLAIINILPLPALDGGRIAFVLLGWVRRGKRVSAKTEGIVHLIGFAMLMGLVLLITYQDIFRIMSGESVLP